LAVVDLAAETQASRPLTPQTSDRRSDLVTVLGFGLPVLVYLWFLHHYSLNVVHADQWSDVNLIRASYSGHLNLAALWAQHNENRMLFPNLLVLAMSRLDAFNVSAEEYLSALLLISAVALIVAAHRRRVPYRPWVAYCPVVILMFSVVQAQNTLWGFQLAWYLVLLLLTGVLFLLDRPALSIVGTLGAIILAIVGSYSSFQGLLIWVAGLLLLFYRRRPGYLVVVWVAAGVLTTAIYFYNFNSHAAVAPNLTPIHLPTQAVRFYFESLGDVLGVPLTSYGVRADLITAAGCVIFAVALFTLWSSGRHRDAQSAAPIGIALTIFGLLFAFSTTYGRAWAGPGAASASRYTTYELLVLVGAYLTYIGTPPKAERARGPSRAVRGLVGTTLGCLVALVAVFGLVNGIRWARASRQAYVTAAAVTTDSTRIPGPVVQRSLEPAIPAGQLQADAQVLESHGLSLYSDAQAVATYRHLAAIDTAEGLFKYTPAPPTRVEIPSTGSVVSGKTLLLASAAQDLHPVRVHFVLSGGVVPRQVLVAKQFSLGWGLFWNASTVPNGAYQLASVVDGQSGVVTKSVPISVVVRH
jgi:hypothetical protein